MTNCSTNRKDISRFSVLQIRRGTRGRRDVATLERGLATKRREVHRDARTQLPPKYVSNDEVQECTRASRQRMNPMHCDIQSVAYGVTIGAIIHSILLSLLFFILPFAFPVHD